MNYLFLKLDGEGERGSERGVEGWMEEEMEVNGGGKGKRKPTNTVITKELFRGSWYQFELPFP